MKSACSGCFYHFFDVVGALFLLSCCVIVKLKMAGVDFSVTYEQLYYNIIGYIHYTLPGR